MNGSGLKESSKPKKDNLAEMSRFNMSENELHNHIVVPVDIDKEQFIEWAKGLGVYQRKYCLKRY